MVKTLGYALFKVWEPIIITPIVTFFFFCKSGSFITKAMLQLFLGVEKKN